MLKLFFMFTTGGLGVTTAFFIQEKKYGKAVLCSLLTACSFLALMYLT